MLRIARRSLTAVAVVPLLASLGGAQDGSLASFAAQKVSLFPVQFLRSDTAAPVRSATWATVRKELDDSIGTAIAERGIGKKWAYAADIQRLAKRNSSYVSDPLTLGAGSLRPPRKLNPDDQASMTLVGNLQGLAALGDSRFALIPVEFWFDHKGADSRPGLRLVMIDAMLGKVIWAADVTGAPGTKFGSADIGTFAQRIADLVAAR